jgi:hypothetical protein
MFEDIGFMLLWIFFPIIWLFMLKLAGLSLLKLTIPSFTVTAMLVYQYIGLPALYFMLVEYRAQFASDKFLVMQLFFYTSITITLMIVGFMLARISFGSLKFSAWDIYGERRKVKTRVKRGFSKLNLGLIFFSVISFSVLTIYLSKVGSIALFEVGEAGEVRSNMGNSFDGKYHWYKVFMNDMLVFLTFAAFANALINRTFLNKMLFLTLFLVALFVMTMATQKAPAIFLIIGCFLVYISVKNKRIIPLKKLFTLSIFLLLILVYFYQYFMSSPDVYSSLQSIFSRTLMGQIQAAYHYLEYFKNHDFLMGASFPNPMGIFPFEHFRLTVEIMNWVHPELSVKGITGSMPTIFWGELFANFGILGILTAPLFVGFGLYWINIIVFNLKYSPYVIALFIWLVLHFDNLAISGLSDYLFDLYLVVVVTTFILLSFFVDNGKIKFYKRCSTGKAK